MKKLLLALIAIGLFTCTTKEEEVVVGKRNAVVPCFHCVQLQKKQLTSCASCDEQLPLKAIHFENGNWELDLNYGVVDTVFYEGEEKTCFLRKSHLRMNWIDVLGKLWYCLEMEDVWDMDGYPRDSPEYLELLRDCLND